MSWKDGRHLSGAAVSVLLGVEHVLAEGVEHLVLVGRLEPGERLQQLNLFTREVDQTTLENTARWHF